MMAWRGWGLSRLGYDALLAAASGGRVPWVAGRYYDHASSFAGGTTTTAVAANTLYACPVVCPGGGLTSGCDRMALEITTAGALGTKVRLGIGSLGQNGFPTSLLLGSAELPTDAIGLAEDPAAALTIPTNQPVVLLALFSGTPTVRALTLIDNAFGIATGTDTSSRSTLQATFTYGPLPTNLAALSWVTASTPPRILVRAV